MNRRNAIKSALAVPLVATSAVSLAEKPSPFHKMEKIIDLPANSGKVVSMVQFHDEIFIACQHGTIYRLFDLWQPSP